MKDAKITLQLDGIKHKYSLFMEIDTVLLHKKCSFREKSNAHSSITEFNVFS